MRFTPPLPEPLTTNWEWQLAAACRNMDTDRFFHPPGERQRRRAQRIVEAKDICAVCPVMLACRDHALSAMEPYGIWGGLSEEDRAAQLGVSSTAGAARCRPRANHTQAHPRPAVPFGWPANP